MARERLNGDPYRSRYQIRQARDKATGRRIETILKHRAKTLPPIWKDNKPIDHEAEILTAWYDRTLTNEQALRRIDRYCQAVVEFHNREMTRLKETVAQKVQEELDKLKAQKAEEVTVTVEVTATDEDKASAEETTTPSLQEENNNSNNIN